MLTKPSNTATKTSQTTAEYVQSRIDGASKNGYGSTKMWVKMTNLNEVQELLNTSGFKFTEVARDPKSVQLEVSW